MISLIPHDDWIKHRHDEQCVCQPDIHVKDCRVQTMLHYSVPFKSQCMYDIYEDGNLVGTTIIRRGKLNAEL